MNIEYFIQGQRIPLYEDESLIYKGKMIDSQDINSLFNDFINTFTIPSTPKTDKIFKYWFEIGVNNGFKPNKKVDSNIQFDSIPIRFGKTQLEDVVESNGKITFYKVTFYGQLTGLDDLFGEDELSDLDLNKYNYPLFGVNIARGLQFPQNITDVNGDEFTESDIIIPFIYSASGEVQYNTNDDKDISTDEGRLDIRGFRPAIRHYRIMEAIEDRYNIKFSREFFNSPAYKNMYLWLNGQEDFNNITRPQKYLINNIADSGSVNVGDVELGNNQIKVIRNNQNPPTVPSNETSTFYKYRFKLKTSVAVGNNQDRYRIRITDANTGIILQESFELIGNQVYEYFDDIEFSYDGPPEEVIRNYQINVIPTNIGINSTISIASLNEITTSTLRDSSDFLTLVEDVLSDIEITSGQQIFENIFFIEDNLPELTVADYIKGLIKQFKLIVRPTSNKEFTVMNIVDYLNSGKIKDFTNYVDTKEDIISKKYKTYKSIDFKFEEPDNIIQKTFKNLTGRYRGNSIKKYNVDNKNETSVEIPFEIPSFTRLSDNAVNINTLINIALLQNESAEAEFSTNPISFYYNGITNVIEDTDNLKPIKIDVLTIEETPANAYIIDCDYITLCDTSDNQVLSQVNNNLDYSNFTINGWHKQPINKNLYNNYYKPWLDIIYNNDSRIKEYLLKNVPLKDIFELDLNTNIIINNDLYYIEEYEINLLSRDIKLKLFPRLDNLFAIEGLTTSQNTNLNYNLGGGWDLFSFESSDDWTAQVLYGNFISIPQNYLSGTKGKNKVSFFIQANESTNMREGKIRITSAQQTLDVKIIQRGLII